MSPNIPPTVAYYTGQSLSPFPKNPPKGTNQERQLWKWHIKSEKGRMSLQVCKDSLGMTIISESNILNDPKLRIVSFCCGGECGREKGWGSREGETGNQQGAASRSQGCVGLPSEMPEKPPKDCLPRRKFCCPPWVKNLHFSHFIISQQWALSENDNYIAFFFVQLARDVLTVPLRFWMWSSFTCGPTFSW